MPTQPSPLLERASNATRAAVESRCPTCEQPIAYEQAEEIRRRIREKENQAAAKVEERIRRETELVRQEATEAATKAMEERLAEADRKRKEAEEATEALKASHDQDVSDRVAEAREACEADKLQAINKEKAAAFQERQKLEEELARVSRQLQRKTSNELGEGAEVDLFEVLNSAFPEDKIRRVPKGEPGADIVHEVFDNGVKCGTIVYDSKNRARWLNDYVDKLRRDQLAEKADHAVLTTSKFPSGARQLHLQDGVIVTNPARALVVAQILRRHVVVVNSLRLSNDGRDDKTTKLYDFITSEQCSQEIEQLETVSERLLELDVQEKRAHDKVWKDRGALVRQSQRTLAELTTEIDRIVGQPDVTAATA